MKPSTEPATTPQNNDLNWLGLACEFDMLAGMRMVYWWSQPVLRHVSAYIVDMGSREQEKKQENGAADDACPWFPEDPARPGAGGKCRRRSIIIRVPFGFASVKSRHDTRLDASWPCMHWLAISEMYIDLLSTSASRLHYSMNDR